MNFNGLLFQFGSYEFPQKYIKIESYDSLPNQRQSLDGYTDANGDTHMNNLSHVKSQISFTTRELTGEEMAEIMHNITSNYVNAKERSAMCVYYDNEYDRYVTGDMYLDQSLKLPIKRLSKDGKKIEKYKEVTWTFIEKGRNLGV
jgi:galactose-1-phosphate uridylyltransferase